METAEEFKQKLKQYELAANKNKWYNKKWAVALLCVVFFPVGLFGLWKSDVISTVYKATITGFFCIVFLIVISNVDNNNAPAVAELKKEIAVKKVNQDSIDIERLKVEIENVTTFDGSIYRDSYEAIGLELELLKDWSDIVDRRKKSNNEEVKKMALNLEVELIKLQKKEFPLLRRAWASIAKEKLWEQDIYVSLSTNQIVNFSGGYFAANKNIKDTQVQLSDMLKKLRFKQTRYRWYKEADEYTYYDIESKKDTEL